VVADIAKLSVGREEYYARELATDHEAYLSGHGESPGRWYGAGAGNLGLQGEASPASFRRMFEGRHPDTGGLLGRPHGRNAVPAFDVVLRPAKSVSILYGLGDPMTGRVVLAAHHAGVRDAVAYLDGHLGTRRGHGGHEHVSGQGLLAIGFDHRTSREGDPLLHTHLVVVNRVQGPDGRWTALDGRDLYRHRLAADAIYRACYQRELTRTLGVEWTAADQYGNRELQGMPESCCGCSPSGPTRSTWRWSGWRRPDGSGHRGWSSGRSTPPASPSSRSLRTPCMDGGEGRRPTAAWTQTPSSGR
jgi:conjugative relaxase-like TrwC/TraI family protein